jgi:lipopolysaccharide export system protein LptC
MRSAADRTRHLIQRIVTMVAVVAGGATLLNLLAGSPDELTEAEAAAAERGYYLNDAKLTELGPDGRPRVVVRARSIEQQLADQSVNLAQIELDYTTQKQGEWHVTADRCSCRAMCAWSVRRSAAQEVRSSSPTSWRMTRARTWCRLPRP